LRRVREVSSRGGERIEESERSEERYGGRSAGEA